MRPTSLSSQCGQRFPPVQRDAPARRTGDLQRRYGISLIIQANKLLKQPRGGLEARPLSHLEFSLFLQNVAASPDYLTRTPEISDLFAVGRTKSRRISGLAPGAPVARASRPGLLVRRLARAIWIRLSFGNNLLVFLVSRHAGPTAPGIIQGWSHQGVRSQSLYFRKLARG